MTKIHRRSLQVRQLNNKMQEFRTLKSTAPPPTGWIKAVRTTLGMSLLQLGFRLGITKQSALDMERREQEGSITLKALREAARAMDMQLVYGFVPADDSLDALIERKAQDLATRIVLRTHNSMILEDQGNSPHRIDAAIQERTQLIKNEMPKALWD